MQKIHFIFWTRLFECQNLFIQFPWTGLFKHPIDDITKQLYLCEDHPEFVLLVVHGDTKAWESNSCTFLYNKYYIRVNILLCFYLYAATNAQQTYLDRLRAENILQSHMWIALKSKLDKLINNGQKTSFIQLTTWFHTILSLVQCQWQAPACHTDRKISYLPWYMLT